jgi:uncharacterized protein YyaL (SSP411 family)
VSAALKRPQDVTDGAEPSGWSAAAGALITFSALTGSQVHREAAEAALNVSAAVARRSPRFAGWALAVAEAALDGPREIAVVGDSGDALTRSLRLTALMATAPGAVVAVGDGSESPVPLLQDRPLLQGGAAAYVCRHFTCAAPTSDALELARQVLAAPR